MAIVCQKCGVTGYVDLLVYCRLCRKAAEHQYCLDTIPKVDEAIEWSCEECNFKANELERIVNDQGLDTSNDVLCLSNKENIIGNLNIANKNIGNDSNVSQFSHKCKSGANLPSLNYELKSWGKTNRRSTKDILSELHDHLREEVIASPFVECSKPSPKRRRRKLILADGDDDVIDNIVKASLLGSEDHVSKDWEKTHKKSMECGLNERHDHLRDELTTSQLIESSKPNVRRRRLVLSDEGDDLIDDLSLNHKTVLNEMISLHRSLRMSEHCGGARESASISKENEDNKFEADSLKEMIVDNKFETDTSKEFDDKSIMEKTDDEMASKGESNDEIKRPSDMPTKVHFRDSTRSRSEFIDMLAMPISWRGWFKVCGKNCGPLIARLSPKAGEKAWNMTGLLPQVIQLTMVSRSHSWPRSFKVSPPTDDNIALSFFPPDSRVEKMVDQLVQEVIRCDLALKVALDEAELLIFPSNLLPENYKRYQDKYYLWGVFKRKDSDKNTAEIRMPEASENNCTKQAVHNSPSKFEEGKMKRVYMEMSLEKDELQETSCPLTDVAGDREMGNDLAPDEELNGCLELFPTHVENMALRLNVGDGKKAVDLELGLGLPFGR